MCCFNKFMSRYVVILIALKLRKINSEVGSSAMPHKINPIHFENAEGNLKLCIDIFESIGRNICINRLQEG